MNNPFALDRFTQAQAPVIRQVLNELQAGRKRTHWMWFVFPQLAGLGASFNARRYALYSLEEANLYLAHPVLGTRLRECTALVNSIQNQSVRSIFGDPDDLKFRSSMTLFAMARPDETVFTDALTKYFDGIADQLTLEKLSFSSKDAGLN